MPTQFVLRVGFPWLETRGGVPAAIEFAKTAHCDRVMLFNCRGHAEPAHYDRKESERRAGVMKGAIKRFRAAKLGVGINNLATVGMNFSPPRFHRLAFQPLVDFDGRVVPECYCPLDPKFLKHVDHLFHTWASLDVDEVWIDDDFRYKTGASQCFCPRHLKAFGKLTGETWTREALLEAITAPSVAPTEMIRQWSEFQNDVLLCAVSCIARAVHRANPRVRVAFMGVNFSVYAYGSDYLRKLCDILSPDRPVLIRPEYGSMNDESRNNWSAYYPAWTCRRVFGEPPANATRYVGWPEGEVWPFARFTHSRKVLSLKLAWGAVFGFSSTTLNVLEMSDGMMHRDDPGMAEHLAATHKHVTAIGKIAEDTSLIPSGVSLEMPELRVGLRATPAYNDFGNFAPRTLPRLGVPLWPAGDEDAVPRVIVSSAALARQDRLSQWARHGLLIDRPAFEMLVALGRDDILGGARAYRPPGNDPAKATLRKGQRVAALERFTDDARNGRAAGRMLSMETAIALRGLFESVRFPRLRETGTKEFSVLSWFHDQEDAVFGPAVWAREWEGRRIVVLPFGLQDERAEYAILNWKRQWQLRGALRWLAGGSLPAHVEGMPDVHVVYRASPDGRRVVLSLANFSNDVAQGGRVVVPALARHGVRAVTGRVLASDARWSRFRSRVDTDGGIALSDALTIPSMETRIADFTWR